MSTQASVPTMYLNTREDSAFRFLGLPTLMRSTAESTGGAFGLMEQWSMPPGFASPYHTHSREDEAFYRRVYDKYREIAARDKLRVVTMEGDAHIDEIHQRIVSVVEERMAR